MGTAARSPHARAAVGGAAVGVVLRGDTPRPDPRRGRHHVTIDLTVAHGYTVAPHLSAQQIRDRAHLADIVARCREAGITDVFVVGGDPTDEPTEFRHAHDLLVALHELDHGFTDIGIGGHPEGHPTTSTETLFQALKDKAPLATHIKTQIVFDPDVILRWARELKNCGIDLPVHVGVPGAVHARSFCGSPVDSASASRRSSSRSSRACSGGSSSRAATVRTRSSRGSPRTWASRTTASRASTSSPSTILGPTEDWRQRMLRDLA